MPTVPKLVEAFLKPSALEYSDGLAQLRNLTELYNVSSQDLLKLVVARVVGTALSTPFETQMLPEYGLPFVAEDSVDETTSWRHSRFLDANRRQLCHYFKPGANSPS